MSLGKARTNDIRVLPGPGRARGNPEAAPGRANTPIAGIEYHHGSAKPRVLFVYGRKRQDQLELYKAGLGPDDGFYGLHHLDAGHFAVAFVADADPKQHALEALLHRGERFIAKRIGIGFALHLALHHIAALRGADCIVATNDACGLPIALLKALGMVKSPLLYFSQGLSDRFAHIPSGSMVFVAIRGLYRRLLKTANRIITLGLGARDHVMATFGLDSDAVHCVPFGIDQHFWTPGAADVLGDYVLSVGSDPYRDYDTLLQAIDAEPLRIVTRLSVNSALMTKQVRIMTHVTDIEVRDLYRRARFVITPLKDVMQPSGQTATLQAMACGKAVIVSATRGLWEPQYMKHNENCYLVRPGDVKELRLAISHLKRHPQEAERLGRNAERTVEERYTAYHFGAKLQEHIREVLEAHTTRTRIE